MRERAETESAEICIIFGVSHQNDEAFRVRFDLLLRNPSFEIEPLDFACRQRHCSRFPLKPIQIEFDLIVYKIVIHFRIKLQTKILK